MEAKAAQAAVGKIANLGFAERIFKAFGRLNADVRRGGMSLEDMAARTLTIFGVYLPQGVMAVKEDKHKWETNGRNAVVWTMTLGLTWLLKNEKWGLNTILNAFMRPRKTPEQLQSYARELDTQFAEQASSRVSPEKLARLGPVKRLKTRLSEAMQPVTFQMRRLLKPAYVLTDRLVNRYRLPNDYFNILDAVGIDRPANHKKAFWSTLDANKLKKINNFYDDLRLRADQGMLAANEQALLKTMPSFIRRLNVFPLIATTLITAATVYLIGDVAMRIVYKFIAPFDHDFDPASVNKKAKKSPSTGGGSASSGGRATHAPSFNQPAVFRAFSQATVVAHAVRFAGDAAEASKGGTRPC